LEFFCDCKYKLQTSRASVGKDEIAIVLSDRYFYS